MSEYAALCTKLRLHSELGQTAADAIEALGRERDAAVADNAALVGALQDIDNEHHEGLIPDPAYRHLVGTGECYSCGVGIPCPTAEVIAELDGDHPGAALLARMERLEAASEMAMKIPPATALNAGHEGYTV